jgi:cell division protein FtsL
VARTTHIGQVDRRGPLGAIIDTSGRRGIGVGAFVLALVTAGALVHVGVRMKGIEVAYDLGREKRVNTQLEEERRRLNIEIGMLKDPVRVVGIARDKLKMGPPAQSDVVRLAPGQVLGARPAADVEAPAKHARATTVSTKGAAKPSSRPRGIAPAVTKASDATDVAATPSAVEAPVKDEAPAATREADE